MGFTTQSSRTYSVWNDCYWNRYWSKWPQENYLKWTSILLTPCCWSLRYEARRCHHRFSPRFDPFDHPWQKQVFRPLCLAFDWLKIFGENALEPSLSAGRNPAGVVHRRPPQSRFPWSYSQWGSRIAEAEEHKRGEIFVEAGFNFILLYSSGHDSEALWQIQVHIGWQEISWNIIKRLCVITSVSQRKREMILCICQK